VTLKTASAALAQLNQDAWRQTVAAWCGETYASFGTVQQFELNRIVDEAIEYIAQRAAHHPWGKRETTVSLTSGTDQTFLMPTDFRQLLSMQEEAATGEISPVSFGDKDNWMRSHDGSDTHQWTDRDRPVYFFDGMDSTSPPRMQWRRVGPSVTSVTLRVFYRPYFEAVGTSGGYADLPASETDAVEAQARYKWALFIKDYDGAAVMRADREDAITALETGDRTETEDPMPHPVDSRFRREMC
jgi:hypothetical protein